MKEINDYMILNNLKPSDVLVKVWGWRQSIREFSGN